VFFLRRSRVKEKLSKGLNKTLTGAVRADFCIGYFNLRGWSQLSKQVDQLVGSYLPEEFDDETEYHARVIIGMQK
jgi:hypothetical protein